jgi:hypothetical protein
MKKTIFPALLALITIPAILTSCGEDGGSGAFLEDGLSGTYEGTHKLNLSPLVLSFIETLVPDTVNIADGFKDTITIVTGAAGDNQVEVTSAAVGETLTGVMTGDNKFKIPTTLYSTLVLGGIEIKNASIKTVKDVTFTSGSGGIGSTAVVQLQLSGTIEGSPINPITVNTTQAVFTKTGL